MILSEETFLLYAAKFYDNPQCTSMEEFEEDLKRFQYLKRLFNRYENTGELRERLILNHIIILYNCFALKTTDMLFFKLKGQEMFLMPFLVKLNYVSENISYENKIIKSSDIPMDPLIVDKLRKI